MRISRCLLALAVIGLWTAPLHAEKDKEEKRQRRIEVEKVEIACDGEDCPDDDMRGPGGERDDGPRSGPGRPDPRVDGGAPGGGMRRVHDPELRAKIDKIRDLEIKVRTLGEKIRSGEESARAEARKTIGSLFDAKLALEEAMLAKMEKGVAKMRERIEKKKAGREKMVDRRLARVAGEDEGEW